jgi:hypothetical protein
MPLDWFFILPDHEEMGWKKSNFKYKLKAVQLIKFIFKHKLSWSHFVI